MASLNLHKTNKGVRAKRIIIDAIIYIFLVAICALWVFPFFYLVMQSLRIDRGGISPELIPQSISQLGFDNYIGLFVNDGSTLNKFGRWYLNTLVIAIIVAIINTVVTLATAYTLSRLRFKGRQLLMRFMLILGMFPGFLSMICIYRLLSLIDNLFTGTGFTFSTSIFALVLVYISGSMMGYYITKGFFDTISRSLDEAAMIDGASRNTIFWRIILPLSKPIVIYTILTAFTGPWGDFMMSNLIVGRAGSDNWTVVVGFNNWLSSTNVGTYFTTFCAGAVFVSIPIVVLFFILQRYYVEGVTGGAVKG